MADPWILGLSASHNGAAALLRGDEVVAAVQEERLSRLKRDRTCAGRPTLATRCVLDAAGIGPEELDVVAACIQGHPQAQEHALAANAQLALAAHGTESLVLSHHRGHAAHAWVSSGFPEAAVLVVDGLGSPLAGGQWESTSIFRGAGEELSVLEQHGVPDGAWLIAQGPGMPRFRSLGGMYSAVASLLFGDPMEAGKVMGLAPLGAPRIPPDDWFQIDDGRLRFLDTVPARFTEPLRWPHPEAADLAASVQAALEVALLHLARHARTITGARHLAFSGGVALNCVANERLIRESGFDAVHIPPAADDAGCALGAAYQALREVRGSWPRGPATHDRSGPQWPPRLPSVPGLRVVPCTDLVGAVAQRLADGQIGGVVQGRSELGPRALGQRSILADPRKPQMKQALNARIKRRESFRPFAPAVLAHAAHDWFDLPPGVSADSPFMLRVWSVRPERRALIPAVVHVDGSARVQTVSDGLLHDLLVRFEGLTGVPILLNTSFNGPGEPLVETAGDALWCCLQHGLDFVVVGDTLLEPDGSVASALDLVPVLHARASSPDHFAVQTPWGARSQRVPPVLAPLLAAIDGVRTGRGLLALLADTIPGAHPEDWLRQALIQLRNARVIALTRPEPSP